MEEILPLGFVKKALNEWVVLDEIGMVHKSKLKRDPQPLQRLSPIPAEGIGIREVLGPFGISTRPRAECRACLR